MCPAAAAAAANEDRRSDDVRILCASLAEKALGYAKCPAFSFDAPLVIEDASTETQAALDLSRVIWLLVGIALVVTGALFRMQRDGRRDIDRNDDPPETPTAFGSPITSLRSGMRRQAGHDADDTSEVLLSPVTLRTLSPLI